MHISTLLSMASLASAAVLLTRDKDVLPGHCCFTLQDPSTSRPLQQALTGRTTGQTYLSSTHPTGWYCLDISSSSRKVLFDDNNSACIVDSRGNLLCVDPTPGVKGWGLSGDELVYGGSKDFAACKDGSAEVVHGGKKSGCRTIKLKAKGKKGSC